ncbi:MAG: PD40 domain-containing protein [Anaerolineaceae bacterium]|nr:MAG: PD40 domain-containing protein [Anaerolineaceae bacterium]
MTGRKGWLVGFWIALLLMVAACGSQGMNMPQSPLLSSLERKSGLIAYVGVDGNIYTINQAGGDKVSITQDATLQVEDAGIQLSYFLPTWSPDAKQLAFIRAIANEDGTPMSSALYTSSMGEDDLVEIFSSPRYFPFYANWSPDGEQLGFLTIGLGSNKYALMVAPSIGGDVTVVDVGYPYYWTWSPADLSILAHVGGPPVENPEQARISRLTLNDPVSEVGLGLAPAFFQAPAYSPDGRFAVLATDRVGGGQSLVVTDSSGRVQSEITSLEGIVAFDWSPKGDRLAYVESLNPSRLEPGSLHLVSLENPSNPQTIEIEAHDVIGFFWSPDGNWIAYFEPVLMSAGPEEEGGEAVTVEMFNLHVANAETGMTQRIAAFQPTTELMQIIPLYDQFQRSATIWSPDGNYLVLSALTEVGPSIFIVPSSGAYAPRFLTEGRLAFWSWK